jgi:hypothetical protein
MNRSLTGGAIMAATTWDELRAVPYQAKLNATLAADIRQRYAAGGVSHRQLAAEYGVKPPAIGEILRGVSFRYLDARHRNQANARAQAALHWETWARRRGYSEAEITTEAARIAPPVRHICEPGTACCAAVTGYEADRLAAD